MPPTDKPLRYIFLRNVFLILDLLSRVGFSNWVSNSFFELVFECVLRIGALESVVLTGGSNSCCELRLRICVSNLFYALLFRLPV